MIEFLVCPVEIIVREPLIPLEAGSQKTGSLRLVATGIGSNLRKSTVRSRSPIYGTRGRRAPRPVPKRPPIPRLGVPRRPRRDRRAGEEERRRQPTLRAN